MTHQRLKRKKPAPAIVEGPYAISDELWERIEPLLPPGKKHPLGCHNPPVPARSAMTGILFVLRTGCQWNALDATGICTSSSAHRWFQRWVEAGLFEAMWREGLFEYEELNGIGWEWQSLDGCMTKAPLGGGKNRPQPHRPGQARGQALAVVRSTRRPTVGGD
jgi:transposase